MPREVNKETVECAKRWEEFIPYAYDDADSPKQRKPVIKGQKLRGTLTIGYGHTGADVYPGLVISKEKAENLLQQDLAKAAKTVENSVKVELSDNQFGALVIFTLNVGTGAFMSSSLLRKLNAGNYAAVPAELARWNKTTISGKKVVSQGLVNRRAAEAGLWAKGAFVKGSGSKVTPEKAPLISSDAMALVTTVAGGGGLQFVPKEGPIAWALTFAIVAGILFLLWNYIKRRRE